MFERKLHAGLLSFVGNPEPACIVFSSLEITATHMIFHNGSITKDATKDTPSVLFKKYHVLITRIASLLEL